jgi:UDPglucose--hexose-1-phosphate uridylyltransferase
MAPDRAAKPEGLEPEAPLRTPQELCPFCEGKESGTPPESFAVRGDSPPNGPGWQVRVVPNRFPAMRMDVEVPIKTSELEAQARDDRFLSLACASGSELMNSLSGWGMHEVVVESPRHVGSLIDESPEHAETVALAYRDRWRMLSQQTNVSAGLLFHNSGRGGGASQEHLHSQIMATPFVPPFLQLELDGAERFHIDHGVDPWGWMIEEEKKHGARVVRETESFLAWCPSKGRLAYEIWLAPKAPQSRFEGCDDVMARELGRLLRDLVGRIETRLGPAFNYYLHAAPFDGNNRASFRWHWEIVPRLAGIAGWELGTGMFINTTPPEMAAEKLR